MKYQGGCHCGKIAFEVEGDLTEVMDCNCSICAKRGYLLWFVQREQMHFTTPETNFATYTFGDGTIKHHFCPDCGCGPFGMGADENGKVMVAVNVRCLDNVELSALKVNPFDGRSL